MVISYLLESRHGNICTVDVSRQYMGSREDLHLCCIQHMMSVWKLFSHFEYLENWSHGLDVTCLLSELMYCVIVIFTMTKQVDQRICIKFCFRLGHSSGESIGMIKQAFRDDSMSGSQIKV